MSLPHEVERLGAVVQSWVEQKLLADLCQYGVQRDDLRIDWSQVVQGNPGETRDRHGFSRVFDDNHGRASTENVGANTLGAALMLRWTESDCSRSKSGTFAGDSLTHHPPAGCLYLTGGGGRGRQSGAMRTRRGRRSCPRTPAA